MESLPPPTGLSSLGQMAFDSFPGEPDEINTKKNLEFMNLACAPRNSVWLHTKGLFGGLKGRELARFEPQPTAESNKKKHI